MDEQITEVLCEKCGKEKRRIRRRDTWQYRCFPCDYQRRKELHPNLGKEQRRRKKELHPHYSQEQGTRYRQRHPDRVRLARAKWWKTYYSRLVEQKPDYRREALISYQTKRLDITREQYLAILEQDTGLCTICGNPEIAIDHRTGRTRRLAIDHNHTTGQVRSMLCRTCNQALGLVDDDPERLRAMANYLDYWNNLA